MCAFWLILTPTRCLKCMLAWLRPTPNLQGSREYSTCGSSVGVLDRRRLHCGAHHQAGCLDTLNQPSFAGGVSLSYLANSVNGRLGLCLRLPNTSRMPAQAATLLGLFSPLLRKPLKLIAEKVKVNLLKITSSLLTELFDRSAHVFTKTSHGYSKAFASVKPVYH
jgi:hypothetical protein